MEGDLRHGVGGETLRQHVATREGMERELDELASVPLAYMEEFYNLRLHVEFVERRVRKALGAVKSEDAKAETKTDRSD